MRSWKAVAAVATAVVLGGVLAGRALQAPGVGAVDEKNLGDYVGVYQWGPDEFVYLQVWKELGAAHPLMAFDESGELRALHPTGHDRFFTGPGAALSTPVESVVEFQRDGAGRVASLTWRRESGPGRLARKVDIEHREDLRFSNGDVRLAGTLIRPKGDGRRPALILVHASGAEDREYVLPFARFLVRHGMAVLGYDKRGVGGSTGDWNTASFEDLAGDVVAAFGYLKTRADVDPTRIGLLGWSQAGWVMPLAAVRAKDIAFLISVCGAGVPGAETSLDHARNEMTARGMRPEVVGQIIEVMKLQYRFARTGEGWDEYAASRGRLAARIGSPPETIPATPDHPYWAFMRRLYFYDPAPTLRQLRAPVLAIFGELDNNILAEKNRAAWEAALKAGGHPDYTLRILPKANHLLLEAKVGNNAEMPSLQRFVPAYFTTVREWLAQRVPGFGARR